MSTVGLFFPCSFGLYALLRSEWDLLREALRQRSDSKTRCMLEMITVGEEEVETKDGRVRGQVIWDQRSV